MTTPRLRSLSVKGFRAFGAIEQTLNLPSDIAVVWGPNSKGKTSLAEAFEFLLTGQIARRELMASSQDEFADALRNAHLAAGEEVYVSACITATDGASHKIKRVLIGDYAKRQDCTSLLEIDGTIATEVDLTKFGLSLSQPPLEAPILSQHTLSYIFSVRPQDRATYFKTLLEVTDLDGLRNEMEALSDEIKPSDDPLVTKFDNCADITTLKPVLSSILYAIPDEATLEAKLHEAAQALIEDAGEKVPETIDKWLATIERILSVRRRKTFPVSEFERDELAAWNPPPDDSWTSLETYLDERKKVDEGTRQLVALFDEALKLPTISGITIPVECPLCGTEFALTLERVQLIRQHVADTKEFKIAETAAKLTLTQLSVLARSLATTIKAAMPNYLKDTAAKRRETGFTIARIRELLGDSAEELVTPWLVQAKSLMRAGTVFRRKIQVAEALIKKQSTKLETEFNPQELRAAFDTLSLLLSTFIAANNTYKEPAAALVTTLNEILDELSDTANWQDFLDIAKKPCELRSALLDRQARAITDKELSAALRQIDRAKEQVLDDKFSDYSSLIQGWWERLRPDEPTFFSAMRPRKGAKRTIDFKAGLSSNPDRSTPKVRDVIAVFSHSQLHCLGLALFLSRAQHEGLGFIILDDPVLSSDEDYRVHFNSTVLTELLNLSMQVIVITQDNKTWKELETRYRHLRISTAQIFIENPAEGSIIDNTSDTLLAKINRAKSLARGGHPDLRKECGFQLRNAGERFCKEMLVSDRWAKGDTAASLTDYDNKTLGRLCPQVEPLMVHASSHPGKFRVFKDTVNHACHDNTPPGNSEMMQACGEIRFLVKDYLGR